MRCSKSCHLYDLELVDLFENTVIEQVEYRLAVSSLNFLFVFMSNPIAPFPWASNTEIFT